jgi:hypothetical protein
MMYSTTDLSVSGVDSTQRVSDTNVVVVEDSDGSVNVAETSYGR